MPVPDISIRANTITDIDIRDIPISFSAEAVPSLPEGVSMQLPIIQMPGCVEAHIDSELSPALTENDPSRVAIFCDAGMPSFNSMNYTPEVGVVHPATSVPKVGGENESPEKAEPDVSQALPLRIPKQPIATARSEKAETSKPQCGKMQVLLQGKCITIVEPVNPVKETAVKYLPPLEAATTTATIATIATVSALLAKPIANFLLKLIKPMIKKIIAKIKKALGKKVIPRSCRERIIAQRSRNQLIRQARDLMG